MSNPKIENFRVAHQNIQLDFYQFQFAESGIWAITV